MTAKQTVIYLRGVVVAPSHPANGYQLENKFSLKNEDGLFFLRVRSGLLRRQYQQQINQDIARPVDVVGYLSTFKNDVCHLHHSCLEVQILVPALPDNRAKPPAIASGPPRLLKNVYENALRETGETPSNSLVLITGQINNQVCWRRDRASFNLRNSEGVFYVTLNATLSRVYGALKWEVGRPVTLLGYLRSFIHPKCGSYHLWIETALLLPMAEIWQTLWDDVGPSCMMSLQCQYKEEQIRANGHNGRDMLALLPEAHSGLNS